MSKINFEKSLKNDYKSKRLLEIDLYPFERSDIDEISLSYIKFE